jgi:hypothetical protein
VRFRASITAAHTRADLDEALSIIEDTLVRRMKGTAGFPSPEAASA